MTNVTSTPKVCVSMSQRILVGPVLTGTTNIRLFSEDDYRSVYFRDSRGKFSRAFSPLAPYYPSSWAPSIVTDCPAALLSETKTLQILFGSS